MTYTFCYESRDAARTAATNAIHAWDGGYMLQYGADYEGCFAAGAEFDIRAHILAPTKDGWVWVTDCGWEDETEFAGALKAADDAAKWAVPSDLTDTPVIPYEEWLSAR